jgi:hypothetical protein
MPHENHNLAEVGQKSYVIFAAGAAYSVVVQASLLWDVSFKAVRGSYRMRDSGEIVQEMSYIVPVEQWPLVQASGFVMGQESILVLGPKASRDAHRPAMLHYLANNRLPEFLGYFVDCAEHVAKAQSGWTEDDGVFYACFHDPDDASEE